MKTKTLKTKGLNLIQKGCQLVIAGCKDQDSWYCKGCKYSIEALEIAMHEDFDNSKLLFKN